MRKTLSAGVAAVSAVCALAAPAQAFERGWSFIEQDGGIVAIDAVLTVGDERSVARVVVTCDRFALFLEARDGAFPTVPSIQGDGGLPLTSASITGVGGEIPSDGVNLGLILIRPDFVRAAVVDGDRAFAFNENEAARVAGLFSAEHQAIGIAFTAADSPNRPTVWFNSIGFDDAYQACPSG